MAKPPEPIAEVLPRAAWVVEAEVAEIVAVGPPVPRVEVPEGFVGHEQNVASQVVRLRVLRVLRGEPVTELEVEKPEAGYALRPGVRGPFLLDGSFPRPVILGRYGPDSYSLAKVEAALAVP